MPDVITVTTNTKEFSIYTARIKVVKFAELKANYPKAELTHYGDSGENLFKDTYCAIHLSHALYLSGIKLKSLPRKARCYGCPTAKNRGSGNHAKLAEDLATWLKKRPFAGCPAYETYTGKEFESKVSGRTGIIYFEDYWPRDYDTPPDSTGDHIDLWDKNKLISIGLIATQFRLLLPDLAERLPGSLRMSDLRKSKQVLFWEIK